MSQIGIGAFPQPGENFRRSTYKFWDGAGGPGARSDFRNKAGARSAKGKKGLERGAILELAGARSAEGKIGGRSLERQGQKGPERGADFTLGSTR